MADKKHSRTVEWLGLVLLILVVLVMLQGCSSFPGKDRAYDPDITQGETLFDQIPNWDGEANRLCGSDLLPEERTRQHTLRC